VVAASASTVVRPPLRGNGVAKLLHPRLRQIRPNRVFLATSSDLHPTTASSTRKCSSACSTPGQDLAELGEPIAEVPQVYEYAVYCDFPSPPQIRIETPPAMLEVKLDAIRAYASQEQIETVVKAHRDLGQSSISAN